MGMAQAGINSLQKGYNKTDDYMNSIGLGTPINRVPAVAPIAPVASAPPVAPTMNNAQFAPSEKQLQNQNFTRANNNLNFTADQIGKGAKVYSPDIKERFDTAGQQGIPYAGNTNMQTVTNAYLDRAAPDRLGYESYDNKTRQMVNTGYPGQPGYAGR